MNQFFSLYRFWQLLRLELNRSRKGLWMTLVITFGFMFIVGLLLSPILDPTMVVFQHSQPYAFTLLITGFILSSLAYRDAGNELRRVGYLTLPVSALEKFLSMWLLTSVGWVLLYTLIYSIYSVFATAIGQLLFADLVYEPFRPFGPFALKIIRYYMVLQGIFLAGAAHFRGYAFPKTLLTLVLFGAVCGTILYFVMRGMFEFDWENDANPFAGMRSEAIWNVVVWMFWWLLAPLTWIITYLGLKEQEV